MFKGLISEAEMTGGYASAHMQRPFLDYAWEDLGSKKPVNETIWFKSRRVIHLWLGKAERNANKRPSER
jgi:hypothetical protein